MCVFRELYIEEVNVFTACSASPDCYGFVTAANSLVIIIYDVLRSFSCAE